MVGVNGEDGLRFCQLQVGKSKVLSAAEILLCLTEFHKSPQAHANRERERERAILIRIIMMMRSIIMHNHLGTAIS